MVVLAPPTIETRRVRGGCGMQSPPMDARRVTGLAGGCCLSPADESLAVEDADGNTDGMDSRRLWRTVGAGGFVSSSSTASVTRRETAWVR